MPWQCSHCNSLNAGMNSQCAYCHGKLKVITKRPDDYEIYDVYREDWFNVILWRLSELSGLSEFTAKLLTKELTGEGIMNSESNRGMTPKEELFSKFYNHEVVVVSNMTTLDLRAHIEELALIALEAQARIRAAKSEESKRVKKANGINARASENVGIPSDVNVDDTSEAINKVKARQKSVSKMDKLRASLRASGLSDKDIEDIISSRNIAETVKVNSSQQETKPRIQTGEVPKPEFNSEAAKSLFPEFNN